MHRFLDTHADKYTHPHTVWAQNGVRPPAVVLSCHQHDTDSRGALQRLKYWETLLALTHTFKHSDTERCHGRQKRWEGTRQRRRTEVTKTMRSKQRTGQQQSGDTVSHPHLKTRSIVDVLLSRLCHLGWVLGVWVWRMVLSWEAGLSWRSSSDWRATLADWLRRWRRGGKSSHSFVESRRRPRWSLRPLSRGRSWISVAIEARGVVWGGACFWP